jgi:hypothetical protein
MGADRVHQNDGKFLPDCMMAYSQRQYSSKSVSRELQMLDIMPYLFINTFIHFFVTLNNDVC